MVWKSAKFGAQHSPSSWAFQTLESASVPVLRFRDAFCKPPLNAIAVTAAQAQTKGNAHLSAGATLRK